MNSIPTQHTPDNTATLTQLESPRNVADNFGARIRGYICPPQDGSYTFEISGDDNCQVSLSTDDSPNNLVKLASINGYTDYRQWTKYSSQQSAPVALLAGHRYYIEVLHKEQGGSDFVSVGWTLPNGQTEAPLPASRIIPFSPSAGAAASATARVQLNSLNNSSALSDAATGDSPGLSVYPNPFTAQTTIEFNLLDAGPVTLAVYDMQDRLVSQLFSGPAEAGTRQRFTLSGPSLPVGMYLVRLVTAGKVLNQKLVRLD